MGKLIFLIFRKNFRFNGNFVAYVKSNPFKVKEYIDNNSEHDLHHIEVWDIEKDEEIDNTSSIPGDDSKKIKLEILSCLDKYIPKPVCKICDTCDTKNRLCKCKGREGDFKYCYRKAGSTHGIEDSIFLFNDINELYDKICDVEVVADSLCIKPYSGEHISILMGKYIGDGNEYPMGFIIK